MPNARKILIVDDDPQLRDALTEQLSLHEEFEAAAAENGIKGVQVAKEGRIDLVTHRAFGRRAVSGARLRSDPLAVSRFLAECGIAGGEFVWVRVETNPLSAWSR